MRNSSQELGLLESQRFLIKRRGTARQTAATYDIFEPHTQHQVGSVRRQAAALAKFLPAFLDRMFSATNFEVRETLDESLVFTVRRTAVLWRQRMEVYDADGHLIGYSESRTFSGRSSCWIYDRRGLPCVEVKGSLRGRACCFVGRDGRELGSLTSQGSGIDTEAQGPPAHYLVSMTQELVAQPLAKMLLLGAALALAIGRHGQA